MPISSRRAAHPPDLLLDEERPIALVMSRSPDRRRWVDALSSLPSASVETYSPEALDGSLRRDHHEIALVVVVDSPVEAAELASRHDVPVLWARHGRPEVVADALPEAQVSAETLLCVRPVDRPVQSVLAECVVEPSAGGSLRVKGDNGLDAVVPMLRAVNRDPFGLLPEVRCAHRASSMVGLCWTGAEPLAERMIHRRNRVVVTDLDGVGMDVTCDAGRFHLHTERLAIGPSRRLRVVQI